ncbi:MAG: hypothetical protein IRZ14_13070 [Chloroflexi bacterium]|jgi:hypothetical protein|nr:hypothetical protein [Chloroflexota bacterium]
MELPPLDNPPPALDPRVTYREIAIEAECESLTRMRKVARVQGFEVYCDEGPHVGGEGTAPSPLGYFVAAVGF